MKKKEYFKKLLSQRLDELFIEPNEIAGSKTSFRDHSPDYLDRGTMESDTSFAFRIKERESILIRKTKDALNRLENGIFGICDECGKEIPEGRLKARPVAALCIKCKEKQETEERIGE